MTNLSGTNLNNGTAVGPQGEGRDSPSTFPTYPAYKDSGVEWLGEVPEHWNISPLKFSASCNDTVLPDSTDDDYEIEYVEISDVNEISGITGSTSYKFSDAPSRARRMLQDGDVLISTVRTYLRAIAPVVTPPENLIASTGFAVVRPRKGILDGAFLGYLLRAEWWISEVIARSVGVSYPAINASDLIGLNVPVPAWQEQTQIARFLDHETAKIDTLIHEQKRLIELLKEKRQAVISHAVTKGLDPTVPMKDSGVEWLGEVPAHWDVLPVWMLFQMGRGRVISHDEIAENSGDYPVYSSQTERDGVMGSIDTYDFEGDYLTWTTDGANAGTVFRRSGKFNCTNVCGTLLPKRKDDDLRYFVDAVGICTAAFIRHDINPKLMNNVMASIKVPVPPLMEQTAIAAYVSAFKDKETVLIQEAFNGISLLQERRSALISAAVTGKIDVRGWQPPTSTQAPKLEVAEAN